MIYLSKKGGGRCRFGPYVDPPLIKHKFEYPHVIPIIENESALNCDLDIQVD